MADREWMVRAKCRSLEAAKRMNDIVEAKGSTSMAVKRRRAMEFCCGCPVAHECALYALKHECTGVIAGGVIMSPHGSTDRRALDRDLARLAVIAHV